MTVSLQNLLKIGQLKSHPINADEIEQLLLAARRNLRDAHATNISAETRFDAAYKTIMQSALAALMMHGYRPDTKKPGHHMTVVQSVPLTIDADPTRVAVLDALRRTRNVSDYSGDDVDDSTVANCIAEATQLLDDVKSWRIAKRPELIPNPKR